MGDDAPLLDLTNGAVQCLLGHRHQDVRIGDFGVVHRLVGDDHLGAGLAAGLILSRPSEVAPEKTAKAIKAKARAK